MQTIIMLVYEFATVLLPAIIVTLAINFGIRKSKSAKCKRYYFCFALITVYLFAAFFITGAGTIYDLMRYGMNIRTEQVNLIPFSDSEIDYLAYGLNVVLFLPFGFLLALACPEFRKYKCTILWSAVLTIMLESSQLLNNRRTDVDDIILNIIGAILGLMIYKLVFRSQKRREAKCVMAQYEIVVLIISTFLGRFLLFNELGAAKLLYGF